MDLGLGLALSRGDCQEPEGCSKTQLIYWPTICFLNSIQQNAQMSSQPPTPEPNAGRAVGHQAISHGVEQVFPLDDCQRRLRSSDHGTTPAQCLGPLARILASDLAQHQSRVAASHGGRPDNFRVGTAASQAGQFLIPEFDHIRIYKFQCPHDEAGCPEQCPGLIVCRAIDN
jgi:hypothetical protein